ncbi:MAG: ECF transporter S component [Actinobacteria bacterium]|nr:ECF transporter S component [Actinomycetota bacterium]
MRPSPLRVGVLLAANLLGLLAFVWPFVLPLGGRAAHEADAPLILAVLLVLLAAVLFVELGRGGLGPKAVALIGVLGAAMVALRLPGFVAGFSAMFIVVLVAGNSFGAGFGFLLGAVGTFASGLFLGGLGPWLPFQMVAVGWVGAGAGMLPRGADTSWRVRIGALAAYGFVAGYVFGAIMNLWVWPFLAGESALSWDPGAGAATNLHHYLTYYAATSFAWDTFRAVGNAALVIAVGRPLLGSLDRASRRMRLDVREPQPPTSSPERPAPEWENGAQPGAVAQSVRAADS